MSYQELRERGSKTAKSGFRNENDIINKFNNWGKEKDAQEWLVIMKYKLSEIESVKAIKITREKTDVQIQVTIKLKKAICIENLQVKLVSNLRGFNQIDKRWVDNYKELWNIAEDVVRILKLFTGELKPYENNTRDPRRMFIDELSNNDQKLIISFFQDNKTMIINDILKGRGRFAAEWMLVVQKVERNAKWVLKPMNYVINHYGNGDVNVTDRGSIKIGRITVQRKGGDAGRPTSNMLQFKINPAELLESYG